MRYAIIENDVVVNVAEAEPDFAASQDWIEAGEASIGWLWDGEKLTPPPASPQ